MIHHPYKMWQFVFATVMYSIQCMMNSQFFQPHCFETANKLSCIAIDCLHNHWYKEAIDEEFLPICILYQLPICILYQLPTSSKGPHTRSCVLQCMYMHVVFVFFVAAIIILMY